MTPERAALSAEALSDMELAEWLLDKLLTAAMRLGQAHFSYDIVGEPLPRIFERVLKGATTQPGVLSAGEYRLLFTASGAAHG